MGKRKAPSSPCALVGVKTEPREQQQQQRQQDDEEKDEEGK